MVGVGTRGSLASLHVIPPSLQICTSVIAMASRLRDHAGVTREQRWQRQASRWHARLGLQQPPQSPEKVVQHARTPPRAETSRRGASLLDVQSACAQTAGGVYRPAEHLSDTEGHTYHPVVLLNIAARVARCSSVNPAAPLAWIRRAWLEKRVVGSGTTSNPALRIAAAVVVPTMRAVSCHFRDPGKAERIWAAASWGVPPMRKNAWRYLLDIDRRETQLPPPTRCTAVSGAMSCGCPSGTAILALSVGS